MKPFIRLARVLLAAMVASAMPAAFAQDVVVIANTSVKADPISPEELRNVFLLRTRTTKDGSSAEPVLEKSGPTHAAFVKQFLNRDGAELHIYYQGLVFTGKASMPKELSSDVEMVDYVRRTRGAIGYISSATHADGVKVLIITGGVENEPRLLQRVEPEYPDTLRRMGIGGSVRLGTQDCAQGHGGDGRGRRGKSDSGRSRSRGCQTMGLRTGARTKTQVTIPFDPKQ